MNNKFGNRRYRINMGRYYAIYEPHFKYSFPNKYVQEHRYIMYLYLSILNNKVTYIQGLDVHHKNKNGFDNRIENLQLVTRSEHKQIHGIEDKLNRFCNICKTKKSKPDWYKDIKGFLCHNCDRMIRYYRNLLFGYKSKRICNICKTDKTGQWHTDINGFLCELCYGTIKYNRKKFRLNYNE